MSEHRIEEYVPLFGKVNLNFTGIASELYLKFDDLSEFSRQKMNDHLGLLAHSFETLRHSRYDYLIFQSVLSEIIENNFKGTTTAQGSLKIQKKIYRGNEILKVWFMLSNLGHCKYTIGDEKALMIHASKRRGFRSTLIAPIKDPDLKAWAEKVINRFDYIKFHHIISIYRIYKLYKRNISKQNEIIRLYKLLLLPTQGITYVTDVFKLGLLKTLYKNIRTLSILSLDANNSHIPISINILSTILSFDFDLDKFQGRRLSQLFDPLTNLLYEKLYLSTQAQTMQRSYEVKALEEIRDDNSYKNIISLAIDTGLSDPRKCHLVHFVRKKYHIKSGQNLKDHYNVMQQIKRRSSSFESSIDFNKNTKETVIDIYLRSDKFEITELPLLLSEILEITKIIDEKQLFGEAEIHKPIVSAMMDGLKNEKVPSDKISRITQPLVDHLNLVLHEKFYSISREFFRNIVWSVLRMFIRDKFYFDLDNYDASTSFGVIHMEGDDNLTHTVDNLIKKYDKNDPDRAHELKQLRKAAKRPFNGYVVACLDRIRIYNYSLAPDRRVVTDIDSLLLKFNNDEFILELNESKNMKNGEKEAIKELKGKVVPTLNSNAKGYRVVNVKGYGGKVRIKINRPT